VFKKILIANRGEIAVRIIKACQEMGVRTVAVFSEADRRAYHPSLADEAVDLGPANPQQSYLNVAKLVQAARENQCEAVHPGYGFLSESAEFAEAIRAAGMTFIGPGAEAMRLMGDKTAARRTMAQAGVPIVPGYDGDGSDSALIAAANQIGYPLLVKAAAGGGGKGMRVVNEADELSYALEAAHREAQNAFGDGRLYLEKYLAQPRHIEFQILADHHGRVIHLFERECSIQRRHQKIIEETPSTFLDENLRQQMAQAATAAAKAVSYVNAGTVEFLVDAARNFYFLEMNTRLQVEHPITEAVTGLDLVQAQLRIAAGEPLPWQQTDIQPRGHAIECRLYAEDAAAGFLPSTGELLRVIEPTGPGVRVDSGIKTGSQVTVHYDPLLAKLIVHAADRTAAIEKMRWALQNYVILGVTTNCSFLQAVLEHPQFISGDLSTHFITDHFAGWQVAEAVEPDLMLIAAALFDQLAASQSATAAAVGPAGDPYNPWRQMDAFRIGGG
jgi:acetyl-CoA carboxylase biotin carboxylase subunit